MSDIDQYSVAFFYDPRYHAEDPADQPPRLPWHLRLPLYWLLDMVLRVEGPRFLAMSAREKFLKGWWIE
jgi:hypothetical protein